MNDYYSMFYVPDHDENQVNLRAELTDRMAINIKCFCNLTGMMEGAHQQITVIANNVDTVLASTPCVRNLSFVGMGFSLKIWKGIPFRSAYFKLDVIAAHVWRSIRYSILCTANKDMLDDSEATSVPEIVSLGDEVSITASHHHPPTLSRKYRIRLHCP